MKLKEFNDIVSYQIATLKHYHDIEASCLIIDYTTLVELKKSYNEIMRIAYQHDEDGEKYMGLLISISTSKNEIIKVA